MKDGRKLLSEISALSPVPVYVRVHSLLVTGDGQPAYKWGSTNAYTEDASGKPVYDWTITDRIFDTYIERKMKPLVQIGFMPEALSSHPQPYRHHWKPGDNYNDIYTGWAYPPKDYTKWAELVYQWVTHCVQKYGRAEVESWLWEVWNEPNIGYWKGTPEEFHKLYDYSADAVPRTAQDLVIATYWTTLATAEAFSLGPVAHFCQGYEGDLVHLAAAVPEIEAAYARRLPTIVVAPHLAELVRRRFGRESRVVPPPLDPRYRPAWRLRPRRAPWVVIPGIYEAEVKGVATALEAVERLRKEGCPCRVLRVSTLPLSTSERTLLEPDRYLCGVAPEVVAREMRQCDLLLFPSLAMEGFGLPLLEAMISKVPVVASRIPSTEFIGGPVVSRRAARRHGVRPGVAAASTRSRWRRARRDGHRAAMQFRERGRPAVDCRPQLGDPGLERRETAGSRRHHLRALPDARSARTRGRRGAGRGLGRRPRLGTDRR
jgi:glycosyltransferase involved in cell wall biosynthesis